MEAGHVASKTVSPATLWWAQHGIRIDGVSVEVHHAFEASGIPSILLKGPSIATWLYARHELRAYSDSDFLVSYEDWDRAAAVLASLGFRPQWTMMAHPNLGAYSSFAFKRGPFDAVDMHATLSGLRADFETVWRVLAADPDTQRVLNADLPVLSLPARTMHLALHAAQHYGHDGSPKQDLVRGVESLPTELWRDAMAVAASLRGLEAFGSGLRMLPRGGEVADRIQLPAASSTETRLREGSVPLAQSLYVVAKTPGIGPKVALLLAELCPRPSFMRWWSPLARRGRRGLVVAYAWRPMWLVARLPAAVRELIRARRG